MSLTIPGVGVTDGPEWATELNTSLTIIDGHNHSSGSGVPITPDGLDINASLSMGNNNLVDANSIRFFAQSAPLAGGADLDCVYVSGVDLYYNDGNGNQVRLTQSGGVAGSPGSISNLTSPASASYVAVSGRFVWESDANTAADMDFAAAILRNTTASSFGLTLQPPTLSSNYSITLPALPASQKFMTLDAAGGMAAPWAVDNSTVEISGGTTLQVKNRGITSLQIALNGVQTGNILDGAVTPPKLSAPNYNVSSSCGSYTTTSTTFTNVTNLIVSITTHGRPIFVGVSPDGVGAQSSFSASEASAVPQAGFRFRRDSSAIGGFGLQDRSTVIGVPANGFVLDFVAAGSYVYTFQAVANNATTTVGVSNAVLVVYEL